MAVTSGVTRLANIEIFRLQVPLALFLGSLIVLVGSVFMTLRALAATRPRRTIFLVVSAFSQKHWLAELLRNIERSLDRRGYDLVLKIPDSDYLGVSQLHRLRQIAARGKRYSGGFIIPADPTATHDELRALCRTVPYPIVFVDIAPFGPYAEYPINSAFIGYSADETGRTAAQYVGELLHRCVSDHPLVLVVGGKEQTGRQDRFVADLRERYRHVDVVVDNTGEFARRRARDIVQRRLAEFADSSRPVDVVFCTSDEMALGALDAMTITRAGPDGHITTIVGVDGTREARALIDAGSLLRATVVQDPTRLAESAVDLMERLIRGEDVPRHNLLPIHLYSAG